MSFLTGTYEARDRAVTPAGGAIGNGSCIDHERRRQNQYQEDVGGVNPSTMTIWKSATPERKPIAPL